MKILITTDWYLSAINGVVTSVRNLEKGLKMLGHDVRILTLSNNKHSYTDGNVTYIGSISAEKIYPEARIKLPFNNSLITDLIDWHPDVVHSQCEFSTFSLAKKIATSTGALFCHTYHTIYEDYTHYFFPNKDIARKAVIFFTRKIAKQTDCFIAPTEKVVDILQDYKINTPIEVMPTGLDLETITSTMSDDEKIAFKKSLGINPDNKIILFVGRLAKEKNLQEIIKYLGKIRPLNTTFLILGDGPYRQEIQEEIIENNISDFTKSVGMVPPLKLNKYYSIADVFVSASQSETQGLTYIEALANGLPLVCRRDDCLNNVLLDGYNGYSYCNEKDFTDNLLKVLNSDNNELKINALKTASDCFSLNKFAQKAHMLYTKYLYLKSICPKSEYAYTLNQ